MRLVLAILSIRLLLNAETANAQDNMSASEGIQSYLYGSEFASSVVNGQPVPYGQDSAPANSLWIQDQNQQIQHMQSSMLDQLKLIAYSTGGSAL